MDRHDPSQGPPSDGTRDRRRSKDVADHLGYLIVLVGRWQARGFLRTFERDEVLSVAYLEADRLLTKKYDPARSTATTFLSRYLLSRTTYAMLTSYGQRKTPDGWRTVAVVSDTIDSSEIPDTTAALDLEDLILSIHPDLRDTARRIASGESLDSIAAEYAEAPLFESLLWEDCNPSDTLRQMLRSELAKGLR